jgi:Na+/proline symporter
MFAGIILTIIIAVHGVPNGFAGVWDVAHESHLLSPIATIPGWEEASFWGKVSLYFHFPVTLSAIIIANFVGQLNNYGADQVMIQRYLSARSLKDCQRGFVLNATAYVFYVVLFFVMSMSLLAFFKHQPIPSDLLSERSPTEFMFPYFIGTQVPPVLKGLILIAIYSAAQSSVSAGISASTSVLYSNFYARLIYRQVSVPEHLEADIERKHMKFNRLCALGLGLAVTGLACEIPQLGESLFGLANKIVSNFAGVMSPVFLLGMFSRRARSLGVAIGAVCGVIAMFVWGFGHKLGLFASELGYGWTLIVGFVTTIGVCYVVSCFERAPPSGKLQFLWKEVMSTILSAGVRK